MTRTAALRSRYTSQTDQRLEADVAPGRQLPEVIGIVALGRVRVMAGCASDRQGRTGWQGGDRAVEALVRREPADGEHAITSFVSPRC